MNCLKWIFEVIYGEQQVDDIQKLIIPYPKNYYYLSLINNDETWSIHGLWPQYSAGSYPTYCKKVTFDINKLEPIIDELQNEWYSTEEPNEDFWKHEWEKHGSCMFTDMDEFTYFNKALTLFNSIKNNPDIIKKYQKNNNQCMIPYDINFNIIDMGF